LVADEFPNLRQVGRRWSAGGADDGGCGHHLAIS